MPTIGVTGHRILMDIELLTTAVDRVLTGIERHRGDAQLRVLSPLAEGADQLVALRALASGADLIVPLPLPLDTYREDFTTEASLQTFDQLLVQAQQVLPLPPAATRQEAYAACGAYILDHCDVLIAIWDGKPAQGVGGTAEIVQGARDSGLPLAWVHAGNRHPDSGAPTSLGPGQGTLTYERWPHPY